MVTNLEIRRKPNKREAIQGTIARAPRGAANTKTEIDSMETRKI
jgi:hypothetical protein